MGGAEEIPAAQKESRRVTAQGREGGRWPALRPAEGAEAGASGQPAPNSV